MFTANKDQLKVLYAIVKPNKIKNMAYSYTKDYVSGWNDCIKLLNKNIDKFIKKLEHDQNTRSSTST